MEDNEAAEWIRTVGDNVPRFLESVRGTENRAFFHYTQSGDLRKKEDWGVFNSVCAARIFSILNRITGDDRDRISGFILSFTHEDGSIYDPYVVRRYRICRLKSALASLDPAGLLPDETPVIRALTRSAFSGLYCMGSFPRKTDCLFPRTMDGIERYVRQLDWDNPWDAGSHFSALVLFLAFAERTADRSDRQELRRLSDHAFSEVARYRNDGGIWGTRPERMPAVLKINGCMKMLLAYQWAGKKPEHIESMIDLCLSCDVGGDGCNNLNSLCVLSECSKHSDYRAGEIRSFCLRRLDLFKRHWWDREGGFSFFEGRSIGHLYGAKIAEPRKEPDIHGTWLHLYGISMIAHLCGMNDQVNFQIPLI